MGEATYAHLRYDDTAGYQALFDHICLGITYMLGPWMKWNETFGIVTFVTTFLVPQQNPLGRLLPRNDLRKMVYFVEQLNYFLARSIERYQSTYLLDLDQIAAGMGRRYVQDDVVLSIAHAAVLSDHGWHLDRQRLSRPPAPVTARFEAKEEEFVRAALAEATAMHRSLRQADQVKLVAIDLDDTLWRGVLADTDDIDEFTTGGWPTGFAEALAFLKQRGILLAIVSKNDEATVAARWDRVMGDRLRLNDFAIRKIDWRPKDVNLAEVMREANLLPDSVVFIDDNPRERALITHSFPAVRVLGADLYSLRRVLLWSAETQTATISSESGRRTEMVARQVERETARSHAATPADFVRDLRVKVAFTPLRAEEARRFDRALELLNKTNQFNTTGRRWTRAELTAAMAAGVSVITFERRGSPLRLWPRRRADHRGRHDRATGHELSCDGARSGGCRSPVWN